MEADALSRIRWTEEDVTTLDQSTIKAIVDMGNTGKTARAEAYSGMLKIPDITINESQGDKLVLLKGQYRNHMENVSRRLEKGTISRSRNKTDPKFDHPERIVFVQSVPERQPSFENNVEA